ncbi:MAG: cell division protein FtsQ/DivIB [Dysgonomonas sp.]
MKKILVISGLCALLAYLIFSAFYFKEKPKDTVCSHFEIVVANSASNNMIDLAEIEKMIDAKGLNPYGKPIKDVNTYEIEKVIVSNKMVKEADVFVTNNSGIRVEISERKPVLRIINNNGDSYYIDKEGEKVPLSKLFVADLPLATGNIKESFAKTELRNFALFLSKNTFWGDQIEQIVVLPNEDIKLIPRVGNHEILLGKLDNFEEKLDKLMIFYEKGLPQIGWNRYSLINLKYDKQVVATKR